MSIKRNISILLLCLFHLSSMPFLSALAALDESNESYTPIFDSTLTFATLLNKEELYEYTAFNLEFFPLHMQARWVGYFISRERLESKKVKRSGFSFKEDKNIKSGSANDEDYKRSGYDRGHLASARDMAFSKETLKESFLFSNISPQVPLLNRGKWLELEKFARKMAIKEGLIYVITGPIFEEDTMRIGKNEVTVPTSFFKALLFYSEERVEAIGFIIPNKQNNEDLRFFACKIDEMEIKASVDVFPSLPDEIEEEAERECNLSFWFEDYEDNALD